MAKQSSDEMKTTKEMSVDLEEDRCRFAEEIQIQLNANLDVKLSLIARKHEKQNKLYLEKDQKIRTTSSQKFLKLSKVIDKKSKGL